MIVCKRKEYISKNYTLRLVHLLPLMHGAYQTQIVIRDAGLRTDSVWARTLCVRAHQAQPEENSNHWAQWGERSVEPEESLTHLPVGLSNTTVYHSFYIEIPQEVI